MKQRFGPINGKQGHRRLNVLFTRARMRIGLFTSFGMDRRDSDRYERRVAFMCLKGTLSTRKAAAEAAVEGIKVLMGTVISRSR